MKNVNITGVHQFLGKGITKSNMVIWGLPKKGAWQKIGTRVFLRRGEVDTSAHYDLFVVHAGT